MQALVVVQALVAVQAPYTILHPPCKLRPPSLSHSLTVPLTNQGRIFNYMSPIYNPPPTPIVATAFRSNHWSRHPKPQAQTAVTHLFLSSHLSPPLSQLVFCLRKGAIFFVLISTPPPNPFDLAAVVLHPPQSLSFPIYLSFSQSLTLSSSSSLLWINVFILIFGCVKCILGDFSVIKCVWKLRKWLRECKKFVGK